MIFRFRSGAYFHKILCLEYALDLISALDSQIRVPTLDRGTLRFFKVFDCDVNHRTLGWLLSESSKTKTLYAEHLIESEILNTLMNSVLFAA